MSSMKFIFTFSLGAAVGSAVTWKLIKTKYERIAQEEIDSVKEVFAKRKKSEEPEETDEDLNWKERVGRASKLTEEEKIDYANIINSYKSDSDKKEEKGGSDSMEIGTPPYVIPPDDFGEIDGYDTISLTLYADGTLADDQDKPITDVDDVVGSDSLNHFGEFEDDSVFVRNDMLKCDFEILLDERKYSDVSQDNEPDSMDEE